MKLLLKILLGACALATMATTVADTPKTKQVEGFGGIIAESYEDSKEWWPEEKRPHKDAPNVITARVDWRARPLPSTSVRVPRYRRSCDCRKGGGATAS